MAEQSVLGGYGSMAGAEEAVRVLNRGWFPADQDNLPHWRLGWRAAGLAHGSGFPVDSRVRPADCGWAISVIALGGLEWHGGGCDWFGLWRGIGYIGGLGNCSGAPLQV
jgi:hypothetical protein